RILRDREMHDPALVRVEGTHLLRHPARPRLFRDEMRHLPQLGVLVLAEAVAVDDDAVVVAQLLPERRGDDVLERREVLAAAADAHAPVFALDVDGRAAGCLFDAAGPE